jgi:mannose-1-phosphate guanylyltransferase
MQADDTLWPVVLAAGEGSRLRELTMDADGNSTPKQFCSLHGGPSLLQGAVDRAAAIASSARTCAIVASQHRRWWAKALRGLPADNVVVQPANKGTAVGILLPLLDIMQRDPDARIVLLPSDHFVREEHTLAASLRAAGRYASEHPDRILLLGMEPDEADPELGYILPATAHEEVCRVTRFLEKPVVPVARELIATGGLWNIFIIASTARALLGLFTARYPGIVMKMQEVLRAGRHTQEISVALRELYERLPTLDFSRHVLEGQESKLDVLRVPHCGWSDLGTPRRVVETLRRLQVERLAYGIDPSPSFPHISLAAQHARHAAMRTGSD